MPRGRIRQKCIKLNKYNKFYQLFKNQVLKPSPKPRCLKLGLKQQFQFQMVKNKALVI